MLSIPVDRSKFPETPNDEDGEEGHLSDRGLKLLVIAQKLFLELYAQLVSDVELKLPAMEPDSTPAQLEVDEKVRRLVRKKMEPDHLVKKRRQVQYIRVSLNKLTQIESSNNYSILFVLVIFAGRAFPRKNDEKMHGTPLRVAQVVHGF